MKLFFFVASLLVLSLSSGAQTTIEKQGDQWQILVDSTPFNIKGATFGYDKYVEDYDKYFQELRYLGVNSIRTWGTDQNAPQLLDAAEKYGIKVMLGIWMRHGRPGMEADDSFDYLTDTQGMQAMYDTAVSIVRRFRDHPAILTWGIGNEVYLNIATDEEKLAYSKLLERICSEIKSIDPNHPITSVEAWTFGVEWWNQYVPSIDIYGINTYGGGASVLPQELAKLGVDKPYVITEFGARGEWDFEEDQNGVKPEPNDQEKYETIVTGYNDWMKDEPTCLGVYVFHYANDIRFIGPYLLTHFDGMTRPQYWAIREAYTGKTPENNVPAIHKFELTNTAVKSGAWVPVGLEASDTEGEKISFQFYYNQRTGSRIRRDQVNRLEFRGNYQEGFEVQMPQEDGGIKVYVMAKDTYNNVGIATTSITVVDQEARKRTVKLPKVELPFYVYQDNVNLPYILSAYMGNYQAMEVDLDHRENVHSGETAIKIRYAEKTGWYGVGFVDPPGDWGNLPGGYDIGNAQTFSFWAKASYDGLKVKAGLGLIESDQNYPDSAKEIEEWELTREWKKYTIKTKKMDLGMIRSGFVLFSQGEGLTHTIYIDDIVFE